MKRLASRAWTLVLLLASPEFVGATQTDESTILPAIQQPRRGADGTFRFQLFGGLGDRAIIQVSEDLVNWASFGSFVITTVPMEIVDPASRNFATRFYRAVPDDSSTGPTIAADHESASTIQTTKAVSPSPSTSTENQRHALSQRPAPGSRDAFDLPGWWEPAVRSRKQAIIERLNRIRIDNFTATKLRLDDLLIFLSKESRRADPTGHGINFIINRSTAIPVTNSNQLRVDPATGFPMATDPGEVGVTVDPLRNASVLMILDEMVKGAQQPINYSINDYAVVLSLKYSPEERSQPNA